jgi:mono/diheme cytochrome c family protein
VLIGGGEPYLYAFDKATGREVGRVPTPLRTSGTPMTYRTRAGRQFVVVATGAGPDGTLAAFTLQGGRVPTSAATASPGAQPSQAQPGNVAFARICESCHGREGRNGLAPALVPMTRSANEVLAIVREGIGQMPPVSPRELSDADVGQIVDYLRSLRR